MYAVVGILRVHNSAGSVKAGLEDELTRRIHAGGIPRGSSATLAKD